MSNEETLQEYNERLEENNTSLANVLTTINNLPEASGSSTEVYSTEEVKTNKVWIDGRPIYRKVINYGALPNASEQKVPHNISDIDYFTNASAIAFFKESNGYTLNLFLPLSSTASLSACIYFMADIQDVTIGTGKDRRNFTNCYVTLEYVKTTD